MSSEFRHYTVNINSDWLVKLINYQKSLEEKQYCKIKVAVKIKIAKIILTLHNSFAPEGGNGVA